MEEIGGYFELELRSGEHYHKEALRLNTARNCFEYVLRARGYTKIYIPYYTCEVILEPLQKLGISYEFYHINYHLEPQTYPILKSGEAFLYTNYFGLKQVCVHKLVEKYGNQLIVDNAQAFYAKRIEGIDTFYSPRKFFGVPDGGYLYTDCKLDYKLSQDKSYSRMQHLLIRIDEGAETGYQLFKETSKLLNNAPIMQMSNITDKILQNIDYEHVRKIRRSNFQILDNILSCNNKLDIHLEENDVPMVYPYYSNNTHLRKLLISNRIYVATYWPNVLKWSKHESIEFKLAQRIIPLPIDQRYANNTMSTIIKYIEK